MTYVHYKIMEMKKIRSDKIFGITMGLVVIIIGIIAITYRTEDFCSIKQVLWLLQQRGRY